ncbi:MAG TPA: hypothetical protein VEZ46_11680 [Mycobacteriales bacterium]|nr:hypothetical protein [Mycobacteriales bacterium]
MKVNKDGIGVDAPRGWDARIYKRVPEADGVASSHAILHAGNFALPADRGDYGSGAVDVMGSEHVFVSLVEFHPDAAQRELFSTRGLPKLTPGSFSPNKLQRTIEGQAGCQFFFNLEGRAFCLFVVLGDYGNRVALTKVANELIGQLEISPATATR